MLDELPDDLRSRCRPSVVRGNLCSAVNRMIDEQGIDLVVAGSQGETGFRHAAIGSQANAVLETAKVDTALVGPRVA